MAVEFTPSAIATTLVHVDATGHIYDADVYVNGATHVFSLDGRPGTVDFRSIATHEIGHVLGRRIDGSRATMYALTRRRLVALARARRRGRRVHALPRHGRSPRVRATPCPSAFMCVARECDGRRSADDVLAVRSRRSRTAAKAPARTARCVDVAAGYACGRPCANERRVRRGVPVSADDESGDFQCVATTAARARRTRARRLPTATIPPTPAAICSGRRASAPPHPTRARTREARRGRDRTPTAAAPARDAAPAGCSCDAAPARPGREAPRSASRASSVRLRGALCALSRASSCRAPRRACRTSP